jgi:nitrite reductase/ring-hydroxylating ferredoxin subunit
MVTEGARIAVPVIPHFHFDDPDLGRVKARGLLLARRLGRLFVYANVCRHIPLTLDLGDGEVAGLESATFLCHHHGARFRIEDGRCISGPCEGESLVAIEHVVEDGELVVLLPAS